jgi:anti-sigma factor RsiW
MQHPDEGTIHAWLDAALPLQDAAQLEAHLAGCPQCAAAIAEARGLIAASSRIVSSLDSVPAGIIPTATPVRNRWYARAEFRVAAGVLIVAATSLTLMRENAKQRALAKLDAPARATTSGTVSEKGTVRRPPEERQMVESVSGITSSSSRHGASKAAPAEKTGSPPVELHRSAAAHIAVAPPMSAKGVIRQEPARDAISTAVAAAPEPRAQTTEVKLIRSDTTERMKQTIFETAAGVQVKLTELQPPGFVAMGRQSPPVNPMAADRRALRPLPPAVGVSPAGKTAKTSTINTITWIDPETGRSYVLTGPLSVDELQQLKPAIVRLQQ